MNDQAIVSQQPDEAALVAQAQAGVRRQAPQLALTAGNLARGGAIVLLAAGSVVALGADPMPAITWIAGLGGNILAAHLDNWFQRPDVRAVTGDPGAEQPLVEQLAADFQRAIDAEPRLADELAMLLERIGTLDIAFAELRGQGEAQERMLQLLLNDIKGNAFRSEKLINLVLDAVQDQGAALRADLSVLLAKVDALMAEARARPATVHIDNKAPNYGAQGTFNAPMTFGVPPKRDAD